jgi:hypothetical protein
MSIPTSKSSKFRSQCSSLSKCQDQPIKRMKKIGLKKLKRIYLALLKSPMYRTVGAVAAIRSTL